jgi:hypothetical protein
MHPETEILRGADGGGAVRPVTRGPSCGKETGERSSRESTGVPPPFSVSVHSKMFSISCKLIRINTCGQFLEVLILRDLWSDKTRQNTVKRGVLAGGENKEVARFELAENKKCQLEAGGTKWKTKRYLRNIITLLFFVKEKTGKKQHVQSSRNSFSCHSYTPLATR